MNERATTLSDAFWNLDPFAVVDRDHPFFVDMDQFLDPVDYGVGPFLRRWLSPDGRRRGFHHLAIVGHRGSGKTTQVRQTLQSINGGLKPVLVDALTTLDQGEFHFSDCLLVIVRRVVESLVEWGVTDLPQEELDLVKLWFADILLSKDQSLEIAAELKTEASANATIPFIAKLTAKLAASLKSNNAYRKEIRQRAERDIDDLVFRTNRVLDLANRALWARTGDERGLVVIFDNLEKIPDRRVVGEAIIRRSEELRRLRTHAIYFFDPADEYSPVVAQPTSVFPHHIMPMLPVRTEKQAMDTVAPCVFQAIRALLDRRMDVAALFENQDAAIETIARSSGGLLRDVLHITRLVCELESTPKVSLSTIERAVRKLAAQRLSLAQTEHWPQLRGIHKSKRLSNNALDSYLLQHSLVLNYNGQPWWDVHPWVLTDDRFNTTS